MSDSEQQPHRTIGQHIIRGSLFSMVMRWIIRGIGLISIIILARLLTPEDFGIVAISTITLGILEAFANFGISFLVIRENDRSPQFLNTAWTMSILQGAVIGILLALSAPLIVAWFNEPRAEATMYVTALAAFAGGFTNVGMTLARKELDYARDFRFEVYSKLSTTATTLLLAYIYQSYWALIVGMVTGSLIRVILSFGMHAYRPAFCMQEHRQFMHFGIKAIILNLSRYWNLRVDSILVGNAYGAATLGLYNTANEITRMATTEVTYPIARALLPAYAKIKEDLPLLRRTYLRSLGAIVLLCIASSLGLHAIGEDFVRVILGDRWVGAEKLIVLLAFLALSDAILQTMVSNVFLIIGRESIDIWLRIARAALMTPAIAVAAYYADPETVAITAAAVTTLFIPATALLARKYLGITLGDLLNILWRPCIAGFIMLLAVGLIQDMAITPAIRMILSIIIGALTYAASIFLIWFFAGRPLESIESLLFQKIGMQRICRHAD